MYFNNYDHLIIKENNLTATYTFSNKYVIINNAIHNHILYFLRDLFFMVLDIIQFYKILLLSRILLLLLLSKDFIIQKRTNGVARRDPFSSVRYKAEPLKKSYLSSYLEKSL